MRIMYLLFLLQHKPYGDVLDVEIDERTASGVDTFVLESIPANAVYINRRKHKKLYNKVC